MGVGGPYAPSGPVGATGVAWGMPMCPRAREIAYSSKSGWANQKTARSFKLSFIGRTSTASGRIVGEQGAGWGARGSRVAGGAVVALCAVAMGAGTKFYTRS